MPKGLEYLAVDFRNIDPMTDMIVTVESTDWVENITEINFLGYKMELIPESSTSDAIIRFPLGDVFFKAGQNANWPTVVELFSLVLRLLSIFSWAYKISFECNGLMTVVTGLGVKTRLNNIHVKNFITPTDLFIWADEKTKLALALYRQALTTASIPLQFLSFAKILNIQYVDRIQIAAFNRITGLLTETKAVNRVRELDSMGIDVGERLYKSGRCAIAHANVQPTIDPDDPTDSYELNLDMPIVRGVAEYIIQVELNLQNIQIIQA
ncbi:MAG: methylamine utilization protein MauJ [Bacteroidales bacterium]|jgi:hypothetical protein